MGRKRNPLQADRFSLVLAATTIVAFLALLWASFTASERMAETQGPSRLGVAHDGSVWVNSHAGLHQLARDGTRLRSIPLADLGLGPLLSHVRVLRDGRLIVGQAVPSGLSRCDMGSLRCERLLADGETRHALMLAIDEAAGRIAVSDNAGHRLLLLDMNGRLLDATPRGRFLHPNGIAFLPDGTILVSDTDRMALVQVAVGRDRIGAGLESFMVHVGPLRAGRHHPMEFAPTADGKWWVLVAAEGMRDADLMIHQPLGVPRHRVDLGPRSDPTDVVPFASGVLVAEPIRVDLLEVSRDGGKVQPFGAPEFRAELDATRRKHALWTIARDFGPVGMAALPVLCVLVLWARGMRAGHITGAIRREDLPPPATLEAGVTWLQYDHRYLQRLKRTMNALLAASAVALFALVIVLARSSPGLPTTTIGLMVAGIALCLAAMYFLRRRGVEPPHWIGVDGSALVLRTKGGDVRRVSLEEVRTDGRLLVAGPTVIAYRTWAGDTFLGRQIESVVLSRLPPEAWLKPMQFWLWALRRQQPRALVAPALFAIVLAAGAAWLAARLLG